MQWQVLLGTVVEGLLSSEGPKLQGTREGLEAASLGPRTARAAACLRAALPSLMREHSASGLHADHFQLAAMLSTCM